MTHDAASNPAVPPAAAQRAGGSEPVRIGPMLVPVLCTASALAAAGLMGSGSGPHLDPRVALLAAWATWPIAAAVVLDAHPGSNIARLMSAMGLLPSAAVVSAALAGGASLASAFAALHSLGGFAATGSLVAAPLLVVGRAVRPMVVGVAVLGASAVATGWPLPGWALVAAAISLTAGATARPGGGEQGRRRGFWTTAFLCLGTACVGAFLATGIESVSRDGVFGLAWAIAVAPIALAALIARPALGPPGGPLLDAVLTAAGVVGVAAALILGRDLFARLGVAQAGAAAAVASCLVAAAAVPTIVATRSRLLVSWYGSGRLPSRALGELNERLRDADDPRQLLGAAAEAAAIAVRSQGAAITLGPDEPDADPDDVVVPLQVCGEQVGTLLVRPRGPDRPLEPRDLDVLATLCVPIALVARAVGVAVDSELARRDDLRARTLERERILADLHDGLGPMLAGLSMGLASVQRSAAPDHELASTLSRIAEGLGEARTELRRIVTGLAPGQLTRTDLCTALGELVGQINAGGGPETPSVVLDADLPTPLATEVAVTAYRTVAEALANVLRHSRATSSSVGIRVTGSGLLEITVADDGVGLPSGHAFRLGVGLASLRRRAEALGGSMDISPRAGGGTLLAVSLPTQEVP